MEANDLVRSAVDPVVIVGMACRLPGDVTTPEDLWRIVMEGADVLSEFPTDRGWGPDLHDTDPASTGKVYLRKSGFLHDAAQFDPDFFGISRREALAMDPQQRLLLEMTWEALERARISPMSLRGSRTGVYTGVTNTDYGVRWMSGSHGLPEFEGYLVLGSSNAAASGRISYLLGLSGPSLTVDTACSSSLVALHLAIQALRSGECDMAVVGGSTVHTTPGVYQDFSRQRALTTDGRLRSYAEGADGTAFGDGGGVLVLERLSDARHRGHPVLAVVRGTAVNQDGASSQLSAPSSTAQAEMIRLALADAGLSPAEVDAVEGHGTGTKLGDPAEAAAIVATYGQDRPADRPLWLGSVKSNISHTVAAAGVAGVIKAVLAMRHGVLPKTLNVDQPSTRVDWNDGAVRLLTEVQPWPETGRPRRIGVSSFGISGTNAHVILEQAPESAPHRVEPATPPAPLPALPFVLTGHTKAALCAQAAHLREHLTEHPDLAPHDVAFSLATTRSLLTERAAVLAADRDGLLAGLTAIAGGTAHGSVLRGVAKAGGPVFVFPGQGTQWAGMARELLDTSPVFAAQAQACAAALEPYLDYSLLDVLEDRPGAAPLHRTEVLQPAVFAVLVSLAAVWRAYGVEPSAVVGHSLGEIAAAHVAGVLSLEDAARLVGERSRIMTAMMNRGDTMAVELSADELEPLLMPHGARLSLAAINGPRACVVSGEYEALDALGAVCVEAGARVRKLRLDIAVHSEHVAELRERLLAAFGPITPRSSLVPFYSTVTGGLLDTTEMDAEYWYRNARQPVLFHAATGALIGDGYRLFLEPSPHPVLAHHVQEAADVSRTPVSALGTLRNNRGGPAQMGRALAEAAAHGVVPDWQAVFAGSGAVHVDLPTYRFQRQRYWLDLKLGGGAAELGLTRAQHPLLGAVVESADTGGLLFTGRFSSHDFPWLASHVVLGVPLMPGAAFVELALHAAQASGCARLAELTLHAPLVLPEQGALCLQVAVGAPEGNGDRSFSVHTRPDADPKRPWVCHAAGVLAGEAGPVKGEPAQWPPAGAAVLDVSSLYEELSAAGYDYGSAFRCVTAAWQRDEEVFVELALPSEHRAEAAEYAIHPALLDAVGHVSARLALGTAPNGQVLAPFSWSDVVLHRPGADVVRAGITSDGRGAITAALADADGLPVAAVGSVITRPVSADRLTQLANPVEDALFRLEWSPVPMTGVLPLTTGRTVVLGPDELGLCAGLAMAGSDVLAHPDLASLCSALATGEEVPGTVFLTDHARLARRSAVTADEVHGATASALAVLQEWLAEQRLASTRLVVLTKGAVAVGREDVVSDLCAAPVWGLVRTAQTENPGRFVLLDVDDTASSSLVTTALSSEEEQLAVREGGLRCPRLVRAAPSSSSAAPALAEDGTVLVTGGTGVLGSLFARHLVTRHGARHLLLVSRQGAEAPGADELRADLEELGARVRITACDVTDREELTRLLAEVSSAHPLTAVIHTAGVLDDGVLSALTPDRLLEVLRPKVDAALLLDELTSGLDLSMFVLFSSISSITGNAGQGNYAAANAFLDALAGHRRHRGLPALALSWGMWAGHAGMLAGLTEVDFTRIRQSGMRPLSEVDGPALFDNALALPDAVLVPARLDVPVLRERERGSGVSSLFRELVHARERTRTDIPSNHGEGLRSRLAPLAELDREDVLLDLVRSHVAATLAHAEPETLDVHRPFTKLGFDSLIAIELRNALNTATGLNLAVTVAFEHASIASMAAHLMTELFPAETTAGSQDIADMDADALISLALGGSEARR
ncbi:type I polyketide synthase [Lentzea sp. DG1S-22]|nr:type I polyketide synthase [Lentzea sp. DG1S-22]WVH82358.1 type I polyketide synthase [Lentzea sp. DG1S-22]